MRTAVVVHRRSLHCDTWVEDTESICWDIRGRSQTISLRRNAHEHSRTDRPPSRGWVVRWPCGGVFDRLRWKCEKKAEVGGQRSEVRSQKSEVGSRKSEVGSRKSEVGSRKCLVL